MSQTTVVVTAPESEDKHAWVSGEEHTLCGIEVQGTRRVFERFPPTQGRSCLNCVGLAWTRFGKLTWV